MMLRRLLLIAMILLPFAVGDTLGAREPSAKLPPLPVAASSLGAVECGGFLYVYGGHAGKTHTYSTKDVLGTFHRLKLDGGTKWEELPGGPILQGMNLISHAGKIYRVGGMRPRNDSGAPSDNVSVVEAARFDPKSGKWETLPPLPAGRSSHDVVVVGDKLIAVGGWQSRGRGVAQVWHDTALILDLSAKELDWREVPQPFKRRALTATAFDGKVYVLGGLTDKGSVKKVDVYDPATAKWSTVADYPGSARAGFSPAACVHKGRLYLTHADGDVLRLKEKGDGWEEAGKVPTPRIVGRLVPWGDSVLAVGGAGEKGNVAAIEAVPVGGKKCLCVKGD